METAFLNSLVGDYLASFGSKLAEKFKKETKATPLPPGSPGLAEVVKHFKETSPAKRKLSMTNGHTPAKKSKKVRISKTGQTTPGQSALCAGSGGEWRGREYGVASYKHLSVFVDNLAWPASHSYTCNV